MIRSRIASRVTFGDRLRTARQRYRPEGQKLTQGGLAEAVGVERNTVSRWENGGMLPKDPVVIASLAAVLQVTADWLISGDKAPGSARKLRERPPARYPGTGPHLPDRAGTLALGYLDRLRDAACSESQIRGAEALLVAAARNRVCATPFERRSEEDVCADVDAAWDVIVRILRRAGIRP
ncbi:MAG: helix-turn-helix domain-containing protein [Gemmatimonadota bacterium]|nr:helix-turn-helix domain-containing protein [Gemmatimonadota bacterium]